MLRENQRKFLQASRNTSKLKPCGELLDRMIRILRKVPIDARLPDIEQDETIRELRSSRLSASLKNMVAMRSNPYPPEQVRLMWEDQEKRGFPISEADWPAAELMRIEAAKKGQRDDEAAYRRVEKQALLKVLRRLLSALTVEFADHILAGKEPEGMNGEDIDRAIRRYNWFRFHHDFMRSLVHAAQSREKGREIPLADALPSGAYIDSSGRLRPKLAPIIRALDLVEVDRIRICANKSCRRIFWAGRIAKPGSEKNDQICCSPECSHASRNQRLRARYVDSQDDFAERKLTANEKWFEKSKAQNGE